MSAGRASRLCGSVAASMSARAFCICGSTSSALRLPLSVGRSSPPVAPDAVGAPYRDPSVSSLMYRRCSPVPFIFSDWISIVFMLYGSSPSGLSTMSPS
jgi:hypothetical protein